MKAFFVFLMVLAVASASQARSSFTATCIEPEGGSDGTITAVYLSGQYPQFKRSDVFTNWETGNRAKLQAVANATGATIAVPLGNVRRISGSMDYTWIGVSTAEIMRRAKAACAGKRFEHPELLAFSSGAKRVTVLLEQMAEENDDLPANCGSLGTYARIVIMGDQGAHGNYNGGCGGRIHQVEEHNFPPAGINLESEIERVLKQPAEAAPSAEPAVDESDHTKT